jgi:alanine racemase
MPRPIVAKIILSAVAHNLSILKQYSKTAKLFAVLKANAYGHGIKNIYPALEQADGIAVLDIQEAILLRTLGWVKPILLLEGIFDITDVDYVYEHNLNIVIHDEFQIALINNWYKNLQKKQCHNLMHKINVFLKANTGMNRLGIALQNYINIHNTLTQQPWLGALTHMTHYATADDITLNNYLFKQQATAFQNIIQIAPKNIKSTCNSAGILWHENMHYEWVRAGIALYGASPTGQYADIQNLNFKACMYLHSKIIGVQNLNTGDCVGYGGAFVAQNPMRIGIVACGYADGYSRQASNNTPISVSGINTHLVGRVSMDMIAVNITHIPKASINSHVELWGEHIKIDDVAQASNTIGYELMCGINQRVPIQII